MQGRGDRYGRGVTGSASAYAAVVLAGGRARRLGGTDKPRLDVGGRSILSRVLSAVSGAERVVVVGSRDPSDVVSERVRWVCEEPPGGGPVAGLAAAMLEVDTDVIVLLAGDMPFATEVPEILLSALEDAPESDAVVPVDAQGRAQPLAAAYRSAAVRRFLAAQPEVHGLAMRSLLAALDVTTLPVEVFAAGSFVDVDTMEDLAAARRRAGRASTLDTSP